MFTEDFVIDNAKITLEAGHWAPQALGAVVARHQKTVILAAVVAKPSTAQTDFLQLTVDYRERTSAVGRIPGGFGRREGRASEREVLTSRLIDRTIRGRCPEGLQAEIHLSVTVFSADRGTDLEGLAITAAGAAMTLSGLPMHGPVVGLSMSAGKGKLHTFVAAPKAERHDHGLVAAFSRDGLLMLEGGGTPISDLELMLLLNRGAAAVEPAFDAIERLAAKAGRSGHWTVTPVATEAQLEAWAERHGGDIRAALSHADTPTRKQALSSLKADALAVEGGPSAMQWSALVKHMITKGTRSGQRIGGRGAHEVRALGASVGQLPACHGDALFTRGETQVLASATLGGAREGLARDGVQHGGHTPFFLHYNFPDYAVGEVRLGRGAPNRRETGHGALAARALRSQLPGDAFPMAVRVVADVLSANGSSSMATVCAGSLALMDAGVPLTAPVAGVTVGFFGDIEDYTLVTDLLGEEDSAGQMDLKVAGTTDGVTALQLDHELNGLPVEIFMEALAAAQTGRVQILEAMGAALAASRTTTKSHGPAFAHIALSAEQAAQLNAQGQRQLETIRSQTKCQIQLLTEPTAAWIVAKDHDGLNKAIEGLTPRPALEQGKVYEARVKSMRPFGAIVEVDGHEGLVHISELAEPRPAEATDVVNVGDACPIMVIGHDDRGRPRLSRKAALAASVPQDD
ncbi:MAG: polyribonucleotide nucleotidyltransferase [Bradymonadia bacterium]